MSLEINLSLQAFSFENYPEVPLSEAIHVVPDSNWLSTTAHESYTFWASGKESVQGGVYYRNDRDERKRPYEASLQLRKWPSQVCCAW